MVSDITCERCGRHNNYSITEVTFKNNTVHDEMRCTGCDGFLGYKRRDKITVEEFLNHTVFGRHGS